MRPHLPLLFLASALPLLAKGDLDARSVTVNDTCPDPGDTVTVRWEAINRTDEYIGGSQQGVMWSSDDSTIERSDLLLEKEYVGPLGGVIYSDRTNETRVVNIPSNATRGRTYYIGVYADYDRQRSEDNENNNNSNAVAITIRPKDLYASDLSINDGSPDLGDLVTVRWTANARKDTYVDASEQGVMLSTDNTINKNDTFLEYEGLGPLGGGFADSTLELRTITIPENLNPGQTYYLGVIMDYDNDVAESTYGTNYENNNNSLAGAFTPRGPDLQATDLEANTLIFTDKSTTISTWPGDSINLEWIARNTGDGDTALLDFSQQAVRWSTDPTVDRSDRILEREPLGILFDGATSPELRTIEIPSDVEIGETYYIAVEADTDQEFREHDETNNFSNVITVNIISPISSSSFNISDFNYLPYLEGEGLEADDPRMRDNTGDGQEDAGVTMNPSRCFAPGDRAYLNLEAGLTLAYTADFNPVSKIRLTAWWNTSQSLTGATKVGPQEVETSVIGETLNMGWDPPNTPGSYYIYMKAEVKVEGVWYEFDAEWLDGGEPIIVSDGLPIILVHGWSDDKGKTFGNLELLMETLWQRPVRSFGYETDNTVDILLGTGTGDGPRVDQGHTEIVNGETKPSLAVQMEEFLASPENDSTAITGCDVIAHSMGGLVSRNYILRENKVRRLVTIGTPSYGGLFSAEAGALLNNQAEDLEFGAPVTWKLHREWSDAANRGDLPRCLTIVGTNDFAPGQFNQSDVVVPCSSASLENLGFPVYYVPLGHSNAFSEPGGTDPETGAKAIAVIEDEIHPSFPALESFLNSEDCVLPAGLPGHNGGPDDVGDKDHPDPLPNGALYIVSVGDDKEPESITSIDLGHTPSTLPISSNGIHPLSGIFAANLVDANNASVGQRFYTEAASDVFVGGTDYLNQNIRVYAGETTVHAINGTNTTFTIGDVDDDGLPDCIEDLIIGTDPGDDLDRLADISPDDDFDGDSLPELVEAALGTDPTVRNPGILSITVEDDEVVIRHPEAASDFGLMVSCESADQPNPAADWSGDGITGNLTLNMIREWRTPVSTDPQFFRIRVRSPE